MPVPVSQVSDPVDRDAGSKDRRPLVVVAFDQPGGGPAHSGWRWFAADFPETRWEFFNSAPGNAFERRIRRPIVSRTRCAWEAISRAKRGGAKLLITTEPELTYRCGLMSRSIGASVPHVAWAFNFAGLPRGRVKLGLMRKGFRSVDRFVVSSTMERRLYGDTFGIPRDKFDVHLWSVGEPDVNRPDQPEIPGDYICAVGSNARDYQTLFRAMAMLPGIRLILVARPDAVAGLDVPPNVEIRSGVPIGVTNNIIAHSRFAVLPLADGQTPNGHVTLVNSMKLARATVITDSEGIADYAHDGIDAVTCRPGSPESMSRAIQALWDDPGRAERLGLAAREFARERCSEASAKNQIRKFLLAYGLIGPDEPVFSRVGS